MIGNNKRLSDLFDSLFVQDRDKKPVESLHNDPCSV